MIFKQWKQVVGLQEPPKGQTRRPVKEGEYGLDERGFPIGLGNAVHSVFIPNGRLKWQVGRTYAVQPGRGKKSKGRIEITRIRRERLGDISQVDIQAEGISLAQTLRESRLSNITPGIASRLMRQAYAKVWESIHGNGTWDRMVDNDVWVLEWPPVEKTK